MRLPYRPNRTLRGSGLAMSCCGADLLPTFSAEAYMIFVHFRLEARRKAICDASGTRINFQLAYVYQPQHNHLLEKAYLLFSPSLFFWKEARQVSCAAPVHLFAGAA